MTAPLGQERELVKTIAAQLGVRPGAYALLYIVSAIGLISALLLSCINIGSYVCSRALL